MTMAATTPTTTTTTTTTPTAATSDSRALSVASRRSSGSGKERDWGKRHEIEEKERFEAIFGGVEGRFEKKSVVDYYEVGGLGGRGGYTSSFRCCV